MENRRLGIVLLLAFSSGLPLALTSGTLQAWLSTTDVDIKTIAAFSLVGWPYVLKFLWAPLMDRFVPPWLGRRRGWILLMQLSLVALICGMGLIDPEQSLLLMGVAALAVAFASASQDVAFDAWRTDILRAPERGVGAAVTIAGYRTAMIVSGGLALILADHIGWEFTYFFMAALMALAIIPTIMAPEPEGEVPPPPTLAQAVVEPFREFLGRRGAVLLLVLIVLYKLGDAFAGSLTTAFLIRGLGFSLTDVGLINKWMGLAATILGALFGGIVMIRFGLFRCLLGFGVLQALTNLGFTLLALAGKSYAGMVAVIAAENLAGGMGTAAFVALLMSLCDRRFTATQYALLSALGSIGRVFIGPAAGLAVDSAGWANFFLITFLAALPGLLLLIYLRREVEAGDR